MFLFKNLEHFKYLFSIRIQSLFILNKSKICLKLRYDNCFCFFKYFLVCVKTIEHLCFGVNYWKNLIFVLSLLQSSQGFDLNFLNAVFNGIDVLLFNHLTYIAVDLLKLFVINDFPPIISSNTKSVECMLHFIVKTSFSVKGYIIYTNDSSFSESDNISSLSANLKADVYRPIYYEVKFLNFLHNPVQDGFWLDSSRF